MGTNTSWGGKSVTGWYPVEESRDTLLSHIINSSLIMTLGSRKVATMIKKSIPCENRYLQRLKIFNCSNDSRSQGILHQVSISFNIKF